MIYATIVYEFNAFHRMRNESLTDAENTAIFGKCANPAGHGHTYRAEITFGRGVSPERPYVLSKRDIAVLRDRVLEPKLAFANLNEAFGTGFISSGENIAKAVWKLVEHSFDSDARLVSVTVIETRKNSFVYRGGEQHAAPVSRMI